MEQESGLQNDSERRHRLQVHAYRLWEERGQPWGSPETDWFRAEVELNEENQGAAPEPPAVAAAKAVGAALGSVAGFVSSLTHSLGSE